MRLIDQIGGARPSSGIGEALDKNGMAVAYSSLLGSEGGGSRRISTAELIQ